MDAMSFIEFYFMFGAPEHADDFTKFLKKVKELEYDKELCDDPTGHAMRFFMD